MEVGWRPAADGALLNAAGEPFAMPLTTVSQVQAQREAAIVGDYWKRLGVGADIITLTPAENRDARLSATFPGFAIGDNPLAFRSAVPKFHSSGCPTEQTRWVGGNKSCYRNPDMDRVIEGLQAAIAPTEQRQLYRDLVRIAGEDLPMLPLYFNPKAAIFREGVVGVRSAGRTASDTWNVAEWDLR
jgi:peptide/nickel transport system substrate-binding protein